MIKSNVRWYEFYTADLKDLGFKLNPYGDCVKKKTVNGSQWTVGWFLNNNIISHIDDNTNTTIVEIIDKKFGELDMTEGKKHTFLGMDI